MKIRVAEPLEFSEDQIEEMEGTARETDPEELKKQILSAKEVVLSPQVMCFLKKRSISPDEFIAQLLRGVNAAH